VHPKYRSLVSPLEVAGELIPYQQVKLHAMVSGYIKNIYVDIGDRVYTGEVLANLEIPQLVAQVNAAKSAVERAEESVLAARSAVISAKATHSALHAEYTRLVVAAEQPGLIAEQELDDAQAKDASSGAQIDAAQANLAAMEQALSVAKANLLHYTALAHYSHIVAPFDGVVTWRYSNTGSLVQAGTSSATAQPVVDVAETDVLRLRLPVPSEYAPFIYVGEPAKIRIEDTGEKITGRVIRTTSSLDLATRTMQVEIDLINTNNKLLPGEYADVTLDVRHSGKQLSLPIQSVSLAGGARPYIYIVNPQGRIVKKIVHVGITTPAYVEILSPGVTTKTAVVATNLANFIPGEEVRTMKANIPPVPVGAQ
jgi:RND family efflux transporter MFP subunit